MTTNTRERTLPGLFRAAPRLAVPRALGIALCCVLALATCAPAGEPEAQASVNAPGELATLATAELPSPERGRDDAIGFLAVGDILLDRLPGSLIARQGWKAPFAAARDLIAGADLAFANLECPASFPGTPYPGKPENVTFNANPGSILGLAWAGFDVVSLANNHMNDYGPKAVLETLDAFDALGLARSGAGANLEEARRPAWLEHGDSKVAVLSYAEAWWSVTGAGSVTPGVAHAIKADMESDVRAAIAAGADYILVSVHWGEEHARSPNAFQREFGRAAIDAGAAAVLGHHPHVLQGVERRGKGLILYSMGNFVFDMAADPTYDSAAFRLELVGGGVRNLKIFPFKISRSDWSPRPAAGADARRILDQMRNMSKALGLELALAEDSLSLSE